MARITEEEFALIMARQGKTTDKPKKRSKYHSHKVTVDGIKFDSQLEADYYGRLKLLVKVGALNGFCRQARFVITEGVNGNNATEYVCDFVLFYPDGHFRIVDTKGVETPEFKLKQKCFAEKYPRLSLELIKKNEV